MTNNRNSIFVQVIRYARDVMYELKRYILQMHCNPETVERLCFSPSSNIFVLHHYFRNGETLNRTRKVIAPIRPRN